MIWPIKDGYLQIQLTPAGAEGLRSRAVSTGLFKQNQGLTLDSGHDPGSMEVRHGDRSVILVWGDRSAARWRAKHVDLERISAASTEAENEVIELVMFFRDPTAWRLPRRMYVQPEASPLVPSRLEVGYDLGKPHLSTLPSTAREVLSANLQTLISDGCQVVSTDQAREMARALAQAGIPGGYDRQRGLFSFEGGLVRPFLSRPSARGGLRGQVTSGMWPSVRPHSPPPGRLAGCSSGGPGTQSK